MNIASECIFELLQQQTKEPGHSISFRIARVPNEDSDQAASKFSELRLRRDPMNSQWPKAYSSRTAKTLIQPRGYKTFFMLNSAEHEIVYAKNMKMPTIVGIFIFISRENSMLSYILQEQIVVVNNLRFISRPNFMLSWIEHEKCFITSGPGYRQIRVFPGRTCNLVGNAVSRLIIYLL